MAGRIRLVTPPADEPVTAAELRQFGRISSDVSDATLAPLIKTARAMAEKALNRSLMPQSWEYVDDGFPCGYLSLPMPPLQSVTFIKATNAAGDVTTVSPLTYTVDTAGAKGQIALNIGKSWPGMVLAPAGFVVRYVAGYADVTAIPDNVKTAILVGALWLRDNPLDEMTPAFDRLLKLDEVIPV